MRELIEEYGGLIFGTMVAALMIVFILWCMEAGGPFAVLAKIFSEITFGS